MWQEAAHPVSCRMCEVCLNWLWWRKLHTLGRTMCTHVEGQIIVEVPRSEMQTVIECFKILITAVSATLQVVVGEWYYRYWWLHWQILGHYRISKKGTIFICFIWENTSLWILIPHLLQYAWTLCLSNYIPVAGCVVRNLTIHSMIQLLNTEL